MALYENDYQALRQKELEEEKLNKQLKIKKMIIVSLSETIGFIIIVLL
jgi:hypothetical protein